jgi:YHS domain-containing protein
VGFRDPVCGMTVSPERAADVVDHEGRRFYFCSKNCAERFRRNPDQYLGDRTQSSLAAGQIELPETGADNRGFLSLQPRPPAAGRYYVPDAPGDCARWAGRLPDLRHVA